MNADQALCSLLTEDLAKKPSCCISQVFGGPPDSLKAVLQSTAFHFDSMPMCTGSGPLEAPCHSFCAESAARSVAQKHVRLMQASTVPGRIRLRRHGLATVGRADTER